MAYGMTVACTPESGINYDSVYRMSAADIQANLKLLNDIQIADESMLLERTAKNREYVKTHHAWNSFLGKLQELIL